MLLLEFPVNSSSGQFSSLLSVDEICEFVEEVVVIHTPLHFCFRVLAVDALAALRIAQHTHLEALAVLLLTIRFLASATRDVPGVDIRQPCALRLAWSSFHLQLLFLWRRAALHERLPSLARLDEEPVRSQVLHLRLEGLRVPVSDVAPGGPDLVDVLLGICAVFAGAGLVAEAALGEALAIHLEALGPRTLTSQGLNRRTLLLEQCQLRIQRHRLLPLDCLLAWAARPALLRRRR